MVEKIKENLSIILAIVMLVVLGYGAYWGYGKIEAAEQKFLALQEQNEKLIKQNGDLAVQLAKANKDYMELSSTQRNQTSVVYVEKESPNDADVEVRNAPPKVTVTAGDGIKYDMTPTVSSSQTIKDGKLVVNEENNLTLDIEKIVDARYKDRIDAVKAGYELKLKEENENATKWQNKYKRACRQRDFYVATTVIGTGVGVMVNKKF